MLISIGQLEIVFCALREHGGSEGPIRLTKFDLRIHNVLHLGIPRIRQDAAVAESTRTPFESTLKPAHYLALNEVINYIVEQCVVILELAARDVVLIQELRNFRLSVGAAPVGMLHNELTWLTEQKVVHPQCGSEGSSPVARGGLNVKLFKGRLVQKSRIGHAI